MRFYCACARQTCIHVRSRIVRSRAMAGDGPSSFKEVKDAIEYLKEGLSCQGATRGCRSRTLRLVCPSPPPPPPLTHTLIENGVRKPQIHVNQALWTIESVARQHGLSPVEISSLMDFVTGQGKGSEWVICAVSFRLSTSIGFFPHFSSLSTYLKTLHLAAELYAASFLKLRFLILPF